ncbi:MAG: serine/threonine-protein kinase, partial [Planctomycetota bacterium]
RESGAGPDTTRQLPDALNETLPNVLRPARVASSGNRMCLLLAAGLFIAGVILLLIGDHWFQTRAMQRERRDLLAIAKTANQRIQDWMGRQLMFSRAVADDQSLSDSAATLTQRVVELDPASDLPRQILLAEEEEREEFEHLLCAKVHRLRPDLIRRSLKFVLWDRRGLTLASWDENASDIGFMTTTENGFEIARVIAGGTTTFVGPKVLQPAPGFVPETNDPVMWLLAPMHYDKNHDDAQPDVPGHHVAEHSVAKHGENDSAKTVSGVLLIRNIGMVDDLNALLRRFEDASQTRVYLINRNAEPITPAPPDDLSTASGRFGFTVNSPLPQCRLVVSRLRSAGFANSWATRAMIWGLGLPLLLSLAWMLIRSPAPPDRDTASAGRLQDYEILSQISSGGMGVVYRARHDRLKRPTAIKVMRPDASDAEAMQRFDREVRLVASLCSPHVVRIFDYGWTENGEAFCVMEYLSGLTVQQVVNRGGPQPVSRVLLIMSQLCDAMMEAHADGLIHRDIHPENIMVSHHGTAGDWTVLFDFGLAKPLKSHRELFETAELVWIGAPAYMAPERFRKPRDVDTRNDIYALGAVMYFMLAGRQPFREDGIETMVTCVLGESPPDINELRDDRVPEAVRELVQHAMAKNLEDRVQTVSQLQKGIESLRRQIPHDRKTSDDWWNVYG